MRREKLTNPREPRLSYGSVYRVFLDIQRIVQPAIEKLEIFQADRCVFDKQKDVKQDLVWEIHQRCLLFMSYDHVTHWGHHPQPNRRMKYGTGTEESKMMLNI